MARDGNNGGQAKKKQGNSRKEHKQMEKGIQLPPTALPIKKMTME